MAAIDDSDDSLSDLEELEDQTERLSSRIVTLLKQSTFDPQPADFLPRDCLDSLVTPDVIERELDLKPRASRGQKQENLIQWIQSDAKEVFAVVAQCDYDPVKTSKIMLRFYTYGFSDKRLPIRNPRAAAANSMSSDPAAELFKAKYFDAKFWNTTQLYKFYKNQWMFYVPLFHPEQYNYDLPAECIFPFSIRGDTTKRGAFSAVHRVTIDPAHQRYDNLNDVAIKEIKVNGQQTTATDGVWEMEARALEAINKLHHPHIVQCIAAIRRGNSRYFMFPWADGDNLKEFWESVPQQQPSAAIVKQAIIQLRGLADALVNLHHFHGGHAEDDMNERDSNPARTPLPDLSESNEVSDYANAETKESIRHGDLKPENILRFTDDKTALGTLKIADMGLAKRHIVATGDRKDTSTRFGTARYEAPETVTTLQGGRSRLYDIWSMGCITLEFIIWLLHGNDALEVFFHQMRGDAQQTIQYFEISVTGEPGRAQVHTIARRWMDHIQGNDPECFQDSAINDLLRLARSRLLVVPLPPNRKSTLSGGPGLAPPAVGETRTTYRASARDFRDALDAILAKSETPGYLLTGKGRVNVKFPGSRTANLAIPSVAPHGNASKRPTSIPPAREQLNEGTKLIQNIHTNTRTYTLPPLTGWEFPVDNTFANKVLAKVGPGTFQPQTSVPAKLCSRCKKLNFWAGGFAFEDTILGLQEKAKICELCTVLYDICTSASERKGPKVRFERNQSSLMMAGGDPLPILSILRSPDEQTSWIQMGLPQLPQPRSEAFFSIIKLWLEDCDNSDIHQDCHGTNAVNLPTRLLDVGTSDTPTLRLIETHETDVSDGRYIALSHPWGDPALYEPFRTLRYDESGKGHTLENFKHSIPEDQLPATFKDTVITTRALSVRYLWIDSLCIIQGKGGDFNEEAKRMEDVFSGAYCVIAASRATGQNDGFLGDRNQREYLTLLRENEKPLYLCRPLDNFSHDVLEGALNQRGWVLQERALARRTIYFAETQTYFECGYGVRCETLARMHNNMADFLGDPKFPNKAMRKNRAHKISYFRDLYQQYSRLAFTRIEDRAIAIAGLEKRLQKAYGTQGGFGIFDDGPDGGLFHRSLLWRRGEDEPHLTPIVFPVERNIKVPSWSWMAYKGGIDYADPDFDTADWEENEIRPPWTRGANGVQSETTEHDAGIALVAIVRDFNVSGRQADEVKLVYDTERSASDGQRTQCVVVARSREGKTVRDKTHYVLLVAPTGSITGRGEKVYKRLGAGTMLGRFITLERDGLLARIH